MTIETPNYPNRQAQLVRLMLAILGAFLTIAGGIDGPPRDAIAWRCACELTFDAWFHA